MEENKQLRRNYFKEFEEMIQESGRPQNIKDLMNHNFKYYFRNTKALFSDTIKGGKCSKNEDTNKLYCGYYYFENRTLKKKYLRVERKKFKLETEEEFKKYTEKHINTVITYPSYNIFVDVFFNFKLNKTYDPKTDKGYLLEYIKEYLTKFINEQRRLNTFEESQEKLFNEYTYKFKQELIKADISNINLFIDFLFEKPLLDSFVINSTVETPTNDLEKFIEQTIEEFRKLKKKANEEQRIIEEKYLFSKTKEEEDKINELLTYVSRKFCFDSSEHLTEEEINLTNIKDTKLSYEDKIKKYCILREQNISKSLYFTERIEDYKDYKPTEEHKNIFKYLFDVDIKELIQSGRNHPLISIFFTCMIVASQPIITETDLLLWLNKENLDEIERNKLDQRLKNSPKDDIEKIAKWKRLEIQLIKLNNDLKALEKAFKLALEEDKDTSEIQEEITILKDRIELIEEQEHESHLHIFLDDNKYYINRNQINGIEVIQDSKESNKIKFANSNESIKILKDTKTGVKENILTYGILERILTIVATKKKQDIYLSFEDVNKLMANCDPKYRGTEARDLSRYRQTFYDQCKLIQGITLDYDLTKLPSIKLNSYFKSHLTGGRESILSITKTGKAYKIHISDFAFSILNSKDYFRTLPNNVYEADNKALSFIIFWYKYASNPRNSLIFYLNDVRNGIPTLANDKKAESVKNFTKNYTEPTKEYLKSVKDSGLGSFNESIENITEETAIIYTPNRESIRHKINRANNKANMIKEIKKSRDSKKKTKSKKK